MTGTCGRLGAATGSWAQLGWSWIPVIDCRDAGDLEQPALSNEQAVIPSRFCKYIDEYPNKRKGTRALGRFLGGGRAGLCLHELLGRVLPGQTLTAATSSANPSWILCGGFGKGSGLGTFCTSRQPTGTKLLPTTAFQTPWLPWSKV